MTWSADLAAGAQTWATGCKKDANGNYAHSSNQLGYGENLYAWTNGTSRMAVNWWYDEIRNYDWNDPIAAYKRGLTDSTKAVGHFTQVVWKASTKLGCGVHPCDGYNYFVCRYQDQGNFNATDPGVLEANVPRLK